MRNQLKDAKGQVLVLVAIMMTLMLGVLMLVLDGGSAYLYRRQAQNAADAAALAGITKICGHSPDYTAGYNLAWEYAVTRNGSEPDPTLTKITFPASGKIQVETVIDFPVFFTFLFSNESKYPASAVGKASCTNVVVGEGVLPLAFPCQPVTGDLVNISDSLNCGVKYGVSDPADEEDGYVNPGDTNWDKMVIVMNSDSSSDMCLENGGSINCDVDGDGIEDIYDGDNRGWLNLNGGDINSEELIDWIQNGYDDVPIPPYTWVGGRPGVNYDIFDAVRVQEGKDILVPVFDYFCENGLPDLDCPALYNLGNPHPPDKIIETEGTPGHLYYRIVGWGLFHVVCIYANGPLDKDDPQRCPFRLEPTTNGGAGLPTNLNNKTIEGYFLSGSRMGKGGDSGIDMGVYWYWLSP